MGPQNLLDVIPNLREAIQKEQLVRDTSFLPITETVGAFQLRPMSLRDFLSLKLIRSPFLTGAVPSSKQLRDFLWLLSPSYRPGLTFGSFFNKRILWFRCRKFVPIQLKENATQQQIDKATEQLKAIAVLITKCREYITETFQDKPMSNKRDYQEDYYSDGIALIGLLAREYGWSEESILKMPMKQIFQYIKEIQRRNGSKSPMTNPSDDVKADYLRSLNRKK